MKITFELIKYEYFWETHYDVLLYTDNRLTHVLDACYHDVMQAIKDALNLKVALLDDVSNYEIKEIIQNKEYETIAKFETLEEFQNIYPEEFV